MLSSLSNLSSAGRGAAESPAHPATAEVPQGLDVSVEKEEKTIGLSADARLLNQPDVAEVVASRDPDIA